MYKEIIKIVLIILAGLVQIGLINSLPDPFNNILIFLDLIILSILMLNFNFSFWYIALGFGIIIDFFSVYTFGVFTIILMICAIVLNILFKKLFTTISPLSIITLGGAGVIIYNLLLYLIIKILFLINISGFNIYFNLDFFVNILWQILINVIVLGILYIIFYKQFKKLFTTLAEQDVF